MIFYDAAGWQAYQGAFNITPYVGGAITIMGAINLINGEKGGMVQLLMGIGLMAFGLFVR